MDNNLVDIIAEGVIGSQDIMQKELLKQVSFDQTVIGEIVSKIDENDNRYWIKVGSIKFEAIAQNDSKEYKEKTQVYVLIPNGDYSMEKVITGSYVTEEPLKTVQLDPFEEFVAGTKVYQLGNYIEGEDSGWRSSLDISETYNPTALGEYNQVGIQLALNTNYQGQEFIIKVQIETSNPSGDTDIILYPINISSKQFWGNPNNLLDIFKFNFLFSLDKDFNISLVKRISFTIEKEEGKGSVEITECLVSFGFSKALDVFSSSSDSIVLDLDEGEIESAFSENKDKKLSITWSHYNSNIDKYEIYNELNPYPTNEYTIYWCRKNDSLQGYKKPEEGKTNSFNYNDIEESGLFWQTIYQGNADVSKAGEYCAFILEDYKPEPSVVSEMLKVIVKNNNTGKYYTSNTLNFINTDKITVEYAQSVNSLRFSFDDDASDGTYNPYTSASALAELEKHYISIKTIEDIEWGNELLDDIDYIVWEIPKNALFEFAEFDGHPFKLVEKDGDYNIYYNENYDTYVIEKEEGKELLNYFSFSFKRGYSSSSNNSISCRVHRSLNNKDYTGIAYLKIGKVSSNGTNYQFNAKLIEHSDSNTNIPVLTYNSKQINLNTEYFVIQPELKSEAGTVLSYDSSQIEYEWYQEGNAQYSIDNDKVTISLKRPTGEEIWKDEEGVVQECDIFNKDKCIPSTTGTHYYVQQIKRLNKKYYVKLYKVVCDEESKIIETELPYTLKDETRENYSLIGWFAVDSYCTINKKISIGSSTLGIWQNAYIKDKNGNIQYDSKNNPRTRKDNTVMSQEEEIYKHLINDELTAQMEVGATGEIAHNAILKITLKGWLNTNNQNIDLSTYVPIALRNEPKYKSLQGATEIVYQYSGYDYEMNQQYYKLPDATGEVNWEVISSSDITEGLPELKEETEKAYDENGKETEPIILGYKLSPSTQMSSIIPPFSVVASQQQTGQDEIILWVQPIMVIRDRYPFEIFNTWDSALKINEEDNYILSSFVGAGKKHSDNSFTGVFMGDIGGHATGSVSTSYKKTGLYGVQQGELRFKFDEDGEAYIGTGNDNHISFANNKLDITSESFVLKTAQLTIDSNAQNSQAIINCLDKKGSSVFNVSADGNLKITGEINASTGKIGGWNIEKSYIDTFTGTRQNYENRFYLASSEDSADNYIYCRALKDKSKPANGYEVKFYVDKNGKLFAKDVDIEGKITATNANFAKKISVGSKFSVNEEGKLVCSDATINGTLDSKSTIVNGVKIGTKGFSAFSDYKDVSTKWHPVDTSRTLNTGIIMYNNYIQMYGGGDSFIQINPGESYLMGEWYYGSTVSKASEIATVNNGSDIRIKHSVKNIDNKYSSFFDEIRPVTFIYNSDYGHSGRTHIGFIANEIELAMKNNGIDNQEFAGLAIRNRGTEDELYALNYSEFIALNTSEIQKLKSRVIALEMEIKELKNEINK